MKRRRILWCFLLLFTLVALTSNISAKTITVNGSDGLSFTTNDDLIPVREQASDTGFIVTITDINGTANEHLINGLPIGSTILVENISIPTSGVDLTGRPIFTLTAEQSKKPINIYPPLNWTGYIRDLSVTRLQLGSNILTDFDNGTFDYIGTGSPQLPTDVSSYVYRNNTLAGIPENGFYTIIMTSALAGGTWKDLRSHTNPWLGSYMADNTAPAIVTAEANQAPQSKFLLINAASDVAPPNNFISFKVNVSKNTNYEIGAYAATLLLKNYPYINPNFDMIATLADGTDILIGQTGELITTLDTSNPAIMSDWHPFKKIINTGDNTAVTISFRNNTSGGYGNDLAIDDISIRAVSPSVSFNESQFIEVVQKDAPYEDPIIDPEDVIPNTTNTGSSNTPAVIPTTPKTGSYHLLLVTIFGITGVGSLVSYKKRFN